jgi:hypothetical protein
VGVLTDYFRAPDAAAVEHVMREDTVSPVDRDPGYDGVTLKGVDDVVLLGKLVTAITGTEWAPGLTGSVPIYPPADTRPDGAGGWAELPADSPWVTGPWVSEIAEQDPFWIDPADGTFTSCFLGPPEPGASCPRCAGVGPVNVARARTTGRSTRFALGK